MHTGFAVRVLVVALSLVVCASWTFGIEMDRMATSDMSGLHSELYAGPELSPPAGPEGKLQTQWEPLRIEAVPDWTGEEPPLTIEPERTVDTSPEGSFVWVLGHEDGIGWFGIEDPGVLGYWGPEGFHSEFGHSILFLEGPRKSDLNPRLFGFHYGVQWRETIREPLSFEVAVAPGIYADFEDSAREGVRIQGHAFGMWTRPGLQVVFGVDYLDRHNTKLLPIAGIVYELDEVTRLELVFPRPRITRLVQREILADRWIYLRGEYSGDSWAVERDSGLADVVTLNEICIAVGTESWTESGRHSTLELGWHFDRELEYASGAGDFFPKETISIRVGSRY